MRGVDLVKKLGNIFHTTKGMRVVLGQISADLDRGVRAPLVGLDLSAVLPVCRAAEGVVCAICIPYENIKHPPYLCHDIHDRKKKAQKVGWVTSTDNEKGVRYLVWLDVEAILKRWDCMWLHLHEETETEQKERLK